MAVNLRGRGLLTLMDLTPAEIRYLLDLGHDLKAARRAGVPGGTLKGRHIALLFERPSTRTRCAFEAAAAQEGARVTFLEGDAARPDSGESPEDFARTLGRFFDGVGYRGLARSAAEDLAGWAGVPVWSGQTRAEHPIQLLADMLTIEERCRKPLNRVKVAFLGNISGSMARSWMIGAAKMGMRCVALGPESMARELGGAFLKEVFAQARSNGGLIELTDSMADLKGADALCGDAWGALDAEELTSERAGLLAPYRVTRQTLKSAENPDVLYLHGPPALHDHEAAASALWRDRGVDIREVDDEVFRGRHSAVPDEAENLMHAVRAVLTASIGG